MGLLILSGEPLGIDDIATRLHVSRASVSTNSRLLQTLGIAQLVRQPDNRRDYLQISGDPCSSLLALGLLRMQSMRAAIHEMRLALTGMDLRVSRKRLERMEQLYDAAVAQVQSVLASGPRPSFSPGTPSVEVASGRAARVTGRTSRSKAAVKHR